MSSERPTDEQLEVIRERCDKATEGPWETALLESGWHVTHNGRIIAEAYLNESKNAEFIAHAREDVPKLVSEVRRLREALQMIANSNDWLVEPASVSVYSRIESAYFHCIAIAINALGKVD